jgi:hypothetical protein
MIRDSSLHAGGATQKIVAGLKTLQRRESPYGCTNSKVCGTRCAPFRAISGMLRACGQEAQSASNRTLSKSFRNCRVW